jgi:hypothetical protein
MDAHEMHYLSLVSSAMKSGDNMGSVKEAMMEKRYSRTLDRSKGANDASSRRHWVEEIRNAMYQMTDTELVAFFSGYPNERERMRVAIIMATEDAEI